MNMENRSSFGVSLALIKKINSAKLKKGTLVAVETEAQQWFTGASSLEAIKNGKKIFPASIFYIMKVGYKISGRM